MTAILTLLGPILEKLALWLYERIVTNYKSTAIGVAVGGAVYETLTTFGCDPTLMGPAIAGVVTSLPKILGTDADKVAGVIWGTVKEAVAQQKHSNAVLSDAVAKQDEAAKEAGIK
jgi:hypothetical protein